MLKRGGQFKPITIRGVEYASQKEAAAALGLSKQAVSNVIKNGRLDTVGLGRATPGSRLKREVERLREALRDTTENGLIYWDPQTSRGAAAKAEMIGRNQTLYAGDSR